MYKNRAHREIKVGNDGNSADDKADVRTNANVHTVNCVRPICAHVCLYAFLNAHWECCK